MTHGSLIGPIVRLQVQKYPIKAKGTGYMPEGILAVDRASVDASGMLGHHDDTWVVDAHHRTHPMSRGGGRRPLSVGFTGHYRLMADRFGSAPYGIAGENILIDGPPLALEDLVEGLVVETTHGTLIALEGARVAAPCLEFTSFMLGLDHVGTLEELEGPLADLHDGRRGFIVAANGAESAVEVAVGDRVRFAGAR
ncbi:MAG: hypothetical protein R2823_08810 [Acidimicrobiia bacterium]